MTSPQNQLQPLRYGSIVTPVVTHQGHQHGSPLGTELPTVSEMVHSFATIVESELYLEEAKIRSMSTAQAVKGAILVVTVVLFEVTCSELVRTLQSGDSKFDYPYFLTYLNHGGTGLVCFMCGVVMVKAQGRTVKGAVLDAGFDSCKAGFVTASLLAILYKYNIFWAAAMSLTSVGIFYSIAQSYCVIVFLLSVALLGEKVTPYKIVSVCLCVCGVVMISMAPGTGSSTETKFLGIVYTLIFTLGSAVYSVLWGHLLGGVDPASVLIFLGMMGICSLLWCWPPILILDWTGLEQVAAPTSKQIFLLFAIVFTAAMNNLTLMMALSVTTPLFVSVGRVLQIPFGALADHILFGETPPLFALFGMGGVLLGFLVMTLDHSQSSSQANATPAAPKPKEVTSGLKFEA
eukprot:TRINITY_DN6545_c0_g1_i1.p1 TRINITY_DN6545_c0_g1~~TRINITY_DN6545_c0_g1_i1.p1  ORF type:complete len:440 (+),score=133.57 TRINITY_DN6545_c0_g1_i1:109-1320(+)